MVNKAVVAVIGVILITTLGVGALVGLQGGGPPPDESPTNGNGENPDSQGNGTAVANGTANGTATPTAAAERTAIPGRQFTEKDIAANLTKRINKWRTAEGHSALRTDGTTANRLHEMAMSHSVAMADEGELTHVIGNESTGDRYKDAGLYAACQYRPPDKDRAIYQPEHPHDHQFEALAGTVAGDTYETDNGTQFNQDESAVAAALLEEFKASNTSTERIMAPGLTKVGVGVEVTRDGAVYSTVHVCGG